MLRWQLTLLRTDPIMGKFAFSEIPQEERYKERYFGHKIPWKNSSALEDSGRLELAGSAKAVFEAFKLKEAMIIDGAENVNIFCRCPYTNIELKLNGEGMITIGSGVSFAFTQEQFGALLEFAKAIEAEGLFYQA